MEHSINGLLITKLDTFTSEGGKVLHGITKDSEGFADFGEAYFSTVNFNSIKGLKKHNQMIMNLIVPVGSIRFYLFDERDKKTKNTINQTTILVGENDYKRITIPKGIWFAFQGVSKNLNLLLNISNIIHDPNECEILPVNHEKFKNINFIK